MVKAVVAPRIDWASRRAATAPALAPAIEPMAPGDVPNIAPCPDLAPLRSWIHACRDAIEDVTRDAKAPRSRKPAECEVNEARAQRDRETAVASRLGAAIDDRPLVFASPIAPRLKSFSGPAKPLARALIALADLGSALADLEPSAVETLRAYRAEIDRFDQECVEMTEKAERAAAQAERAKLLAAKKTEEARTALLRRANQLGIKDEGDTQHGVVGAHTDRQGPSPSSTKGKPR